MAKVHLSRYEAEEGRLPDMCMSCGAQAWKQRSKAFSWYPPWVGLTILAGLLPAVIIILLLTKRMTVRVPLCEEHQNHWSWRSWFVGLGVFFFLGLGVACIVLLAVLDNQRRQQFGGGGSQSNPLAGLLCGVSALAGLVFLFAAAIIQQRAIRPTEITEDSITLTNVAEEFVDAVEQGPGPPRDDRDYRRGPPRRRGEEEERYREDDERRPSPRRERDDDRFRE